MKRSDEDGGAMGQLDDESPQRRRSQGRARRERQQRRGPRAILWGVTKTLIVVAAVVVLVFSAGVRWFGLGDLLPWTTWASSARSDVVHSIEFREDITLLRLGIQGIQKEQNSSHIGSWKIPGTGQSVFLEYSYSALLGINGADVTIDKTGEKSYRITIPEFKFIGYDNLAFSTAIDDGGPLRFVTPNIDKEELANSILDEAAKTKHLTDNRELLKTQCENFYSGIVHAVDPEITVEFVYAGE